MRDMADGGPGIRLPACPGFPPQPKRQFELAIRELEQRMTVRLGAMMAGAEVLIVAPIELM